MRRLNGADSQFIFQETRVQHQHTIKAAVLDPSGARGPLTYHALRHDVGRSLGQLEPLRWKLAMAPMRLGHPWWIEDPDLDLDYHVRRAALPSPGGDVELAEVISTIASSPLERDRPLWQLWHVEGLADGDVAYVTKIHHSLADGVSAAQLLVDSFTTEPDELPRTEDPAHLPHEAMPDRRTLLRMSLAQQRELWRELPSVLRRSAPAARAAVHRRRTGGDVFPAPFAAPPTRFNQRLTPHRWFAFETLDLPTVKEIAKATGTTVNDVFLALVAGSVRRYLAAHDELPVEPLTATVPVSIRRPEDQRTWGTRLTTWVVGLATDLDDPMERLTAVRRGTDVARRLDAVRDRSLQHDWMNYWPLFKMYSNWLPTVGHRLSGKPSYSLIASTVPGPRTPLYRGGARLTKIISMGPLLFPFGLNFTGWSYLDDLTVGVVACREHVPDVWSLAEGLTTSLRELSAAVG